MEKHQGKAQPKKSKEKKASKGKKNEELDDDANPIDFGGLPDRDLKKNLGCG